MSFNCRESGCGKELSSKYNLKRHVECCHEGLRRFQCHVCFKLFSSKQNVKEHMFLHEQEEDRETEASVTVPSHDITIPLLSDMLENSDDYDLKPYVTVVHVYPYVVNLEEETEEESQDELWES
jgi:uncharacterized Zn-finger protein